MGFFKDFKRDFAQAVNELMPDKDELAEEYDDEDMVNTFDENDNMDIAPEDMLEDLDDFRIDAAREEKDNTAGPLRQEEPETVPDDEQQPIEKNAFDDIPQAEIINESADEVYSMEDIEENTETQPVTEMLVAEPDVEQAEQEAYDELNALEALDEENMQEGMEDASAMEGEADESAAKTEELRSVNLNQDVQEALLMRENVSEEQNNMTAESMEANHMAEVEAKVENEEQDISSILNDDTTYITKGTTVKGNIETDGGIDIIGAVEGDVRCAGKLIVGGSIKGNIQAGEIYANAAKLEGDITAEGSAKIGVGSVVVGNVSATSAVVAGAVNGDIDVHGPVIVDSTAVIMGNIKSRSVQINNGAVIEGFCSQCYSEIDVKSFFE